MLHGKGPPSLPFATRLTFRKNSKSGSSESGADVLRRTLGSPQAHMGSVIRQKAFGKGFRITTYFDSRVIWLLHQALLLWGSPPDCFFNRTIGILHLRSIWFYTYIGFFFRSRSHRSCLSLRQSRQQRPHGVQLTSRPSQTCFGCIGFTQQGQLRNNTENHTHQSSSQQLVNFPPKGGCHP